jgi:hypothetical protein
MRGTNTPVRRRIKRAVGAMTAVAGFVVCASVLTAGPASADTFCGATGDGGYGCIIGQPDCSYTMYNSNGEIIYNW